MSARYRCRCCRRRAPSALRHPPVGRLQQPRTLPRAPALHPPAPPRFLTHLRLQRGPAGRLPNPSRTWPWPHPPCTGPPPRPASWASSGPSCVPIHPSRVGGLWHVTPAAATAVLSALSAWRSLLSHACPPASFPPAVHIKAAARNQGFIAPHNSAVNKLISELRVPGGMLHKQASWGRAEGVGGGGGTSKGGCSWRGIGALDSPPCRTAYTHPIKGHIHLGCPVGAVLPGQTRALTHADVPAFLPALRAGRLANGS